MNMIEQDIMIETGSLVPSDTASKTTYVTTGKDSGDTSGTHLDTWSWHPGRSSNVKTRYQETIKIQVVTEPWFWMKPPMEEYV